MNNKSTKTRKKPIRQTSTQSTIRRRLYMQLLQNVRLIWLDANINDKTPDNENTVKQLHQILNNIELFTNSDDCIQFIEEKSNEKICLIVSGSLGKQFVPRIHDMSQIDSIFIFCSEKKKHEKWIKKWVKIKNVCTDIDSLCDTLEQSIRTREKSTFSFSVINTDNDISKKNLDQLDPMFMYTEILKEILLSIHFEQKHILEFTQHCRQTLPQNNTKELKHLQMLENEYHSKTPIWWYTLESCLYRKLNRALGSFHIELMIKLGFFIADLYRHIDELHRKQFSNVGTNEKFLVYRGQGLTKERFDEISKSKGGLFAFNNFLSTTRTESIAMEFVKNALIRNPDRIGVIFIMEIDPSQTTTPFASISDESYFENKEEEILFAMHAIFRIKDIRVIDENQQLFQVELQLTNDNDKDLQILTNHIRNETFPEKSGWQRLGEVLVKKLYQPIEGEKVYQILLQHENDEYRKGYLYNRIGLCKHQQGQRQEAIEYYQKSIEIYEIHAPNDPDRAKPYRNLGILYCEMGQFQQALQYHEKNNEIIRNILSSDQTDLAASYNNIGLVYKNMGKYDEALSFYEKDLNISQKVLPANHPELASSHKNIGNVFFELNQYEKAISFYERTLTIQQQSLPLNHPELALSHSKIGNAFFQLSQYAKALASYEKTLAIQQQLSPLNQPELASSYNNISNALYRLGQYEKALTSYEKTLTIQQQLLSLNHPEIALCHTNIGNVFYQLGQYEKALESYEKTLAIQQQLFPLTHPDLQNTQFNITLVSSIIKKRTREPNSDETNPQKRIKTSTN